MRTSDVAAVALAVMSVLSPGAAGAVELTVLAGMGVVSGVRDVALAFERATGHRVIVSFEAGPSLMQKVTSNTPADLVTHYPEVIDDLIKQGRWWATASISPAPASASRSRPERRSPTSARPRPSGVPCSPPSRSPIRAPARAASSRRS